MKNELLIKYRKIVAQYVDLARQYEALLKEVEEQPDESFAADIFFPPFPGYVIVERRCAFAERERDVMQLLTRPGERDEGLKEIRDFTREAESLIIVDPYFFSGEKSSPTKIANDLKNSARIGGKWLKQVHVVHNPDNVTAAVKRAIKDIFKKTSVKFTIAQTKEIHDRVWIADRKKGLVVGTSLNGIGTRAAFLLPLPDKDLKAILDFLDDK